MSISMITSQLEKHIESNFNNQDICIDKYKTASPFAHCVVDQFLPDKFIAKVHKEFPNPNSNIWKNHYQSINENKLASDSFYEWGSFTQMLFIYLNSNLV